MCLAVPMRLTTRDQDTGTAELNGLTRAISLVLCPEAATGEFVLVHAGFAIGTIDEEEAARTLELLGRLAEAEQCQEAS